MSLVALQKPVFTAISIASRFHFPTGRLGMRTISYSPYPKKIAALEQSERAAKQSLDKAEAVFKKTRRLAGVTAGVYLGLGGIYLIEACLRASSDPTASVLFALLGGASVIAMGKDSKR